MCETHFLGLTLGEHSTKTVVAASGQPDTSSRRCATVVDMSLLIGSVRPPWRPSIVTAGRLLYRQLGTIGFCAARLSSLHLRYSWDGERRTGWEIGVFGACQQRPKDRQQHSRQCAAIERPRDFRRHFLDQWTAFVTIVCIMQSEGEEGASIGDEDFGEMYFLSFRCFDGPF